MYYEDVIVEKNDTVSAIAQAFGYLSADLKKVWDDPKNSDLVNKRMRPENLGVGDVLWVKIPWRIVTRILTATPGGANFLIARNGAAGRRMSWVQTVYRHNQPIGPNPSPFCVDACTPDDELPFYWTNEEIASPPQWIKEFTGNPKVNLSKTFADRARRGTPTAAQGTTKWRAIVSIAVINKKRITVYDSWVWGFNLTSSGKSTTIGPRITTPSEQQGHLQLLRKGKGMSTGTFQTQGWAFRLQH